MCNPTVPGLASRFSSGHANADFDDCFQRLWHYDYVLSPHSARNSSNSPAQTSVASSNCSPIGCLPSDLSNEDQYSLSGKGFSPSLSEHVVHPLFRMLDQNKDGKVSLDEMMSVVHRLGKEVSQSCLVNLMEPLDRHGDMALDFAEFTSLYSSIFSTDLDTNSQKQEAQRADSELDSGELLDTFNIYDKNRDGYISATELAEVLRDLGFPEGTDVQKCQILIDRVDSDGNGLVDMREFREMLYRGCGISDSKATLSCRSEARTKMAEPERTNIAI